MQHKGYTGNQDNDPKPICPVESTKKRELFHGWLFYSNFTCIIQYVSLFLNVLNFLRTLKERLMYKHILLGNDRFVFVIFRLTNSNKCQCYCVWLFPSACRMCMINWITWALLGRRRLQLSRGMQILVWLRQKGMLGYGYEGSTGP